MTEPSELMVEIEIYRAQPVWRPRWPLRWPLRRTTVRQVVARVIRRADEEIDLDWIVQGGIVEHGRVYTLLGATWKMFRYAPSVVRRREESDGDES